MVFADDRMKSPTVNGAANALATPILEARSATLKEADWGAHSQQLERRLNRLYHDTSKDADEAVTILMSFYLGEHNGEELYENLLSRGPRMIPLLELYLTDQPTLLLSKYPKPMRVNVKPVWNP